MDMVATRNRRSARSHDERGMTTAEYAVGTVASVSIVGVLIGIISNPDFQRLLWELVKIVFDVATKAFT
jgi:hypothetical protein